MAPSNNNLFQEFMETYIKKIQNQASFGKAKNKFDKLLKFRNPNFYYGHLHIKYYYFCQQYKDHFEFARSQGHKCVPFAAGFLKDCILNKW